MNCPFCQRPIASTMGKPLLGKRETHVCGNTQCNASFGIMVTVYREPFVRVDVPQPEQAPEPDFYRTGENPKKAA